MNHLKQYGTVFNSQEDFRELHQIIANSYFLLLIAVKNTCSEFYIILYYVYEIQNNNIVYNI